MTSAPMFMRELSARCASKCCTEAFRRAKARLQRFGLPIARPRTGDERLQQFRRGLGHGANRLLKGHLVGFGGARGARYLPDKLQRRGANLLGRCWRREVMEGLDVSAHGGSSSGDHLVRLGGGNLALCRRQSEEREGTMAIELEPACLQAHDVAKAA